MALKMKMIALAMIGLAGFAGAAIAQAPAQTPAQTPAPATAPTASPCGTFFGNESDREKSARKRLGENHAPTAAAPDSRGC